MDWLNWRWSCAFAATSSPQSSSIAPATSSWGLACGRGSAWRCQKTSILLSRGIGIRARTCPTRPSSNSMSSTFRRIRVIIRSAWAFQVVFDSFRTLISPGPFVGSCGVALASVPFSKSRGLSRGARCGAFWHWSSPSPGIPGKYSPAPWTALGSCHVWRIRVPTEPSPS